MTLFFDVILDYRSSFVEIYIWGQLTFFIKLLNIISDRTFYKSISIFKYKLIYYTPQPIQISSTKLDNIKLDPLFSIDVNNGSLYMKNVKKNRKCTEIDSFR